jgi:hypothetical protein
MKMPGSPSPNAVGLLGWNGSVEMVSSLLVTFAHIPLLSSTGYGVRAGLWGLL